MTSNTISSTSTGMILIACMDERIVFFRCGEQWELGQRSKEPSSHKMYGIIYIRQG